LIYIPPLAFFNCPHGGGKFLYIFFITLSTKKMDAMTGGIYTEQGPHGIYCRQSKGTPAVAASVSRPASWSVRTLILASSR